MKTTIFRMMLGVLVTAVLGACANTSTIVQPPKRFFWPSEPDLPRIEWIASYSGDLDVKEKTLMSQIVGDDSSIQFARPISVAGDGEGRFVVSDPEVAQAFLFNLNTHEAHNLGGSGGNVSFTQPSGVAVDSEGNFYVADNTTRKVFVVSGDNSVLRILDLSAHVKSIGGLAVDRARATLVVPDAKGGKVLLFTLTGKLRTTVDGKGYFSYPNAVAVASDGSLLIADTFNATVVRFSVDGKFLNNIGKRGDSPGDLTLVTGVAVDSDDHIYTTDGRLHNVTVFDKNGDTLLVIGGSHSVRSGNIGRGGFLVPQSISIDKNDRIYVADSLNRRVQIFQYLNESYLREHPVSTTKP